MDLRERLTLLLDTIFEMSGKHPGRDNKLDLQSEKWAGTGKEGLMQRLIVGGGGSSYQQRRERLPTPVFLPGESHGQRSLAGCGPWVSESDTIEQPTLSLHFSTYRCFKVIGLGEMARGKSLRVKREWDPEKGCLEAGTGGGSTGKADLLSYTSAAILWSDVYSIPP